MRFGVTRELWAALLISGFAAGDGRGNPVDDAASDRMTALVGQLGDDTFAKREEASKALADLAESALPDIRKAAAATKTWRSASVSRRRSSPSCDGPARANRPA